MRCGVLRPRLKRWRKSRIMSPSTRTVSTRSANDAGDLASLTRGLTPRHKAPSRVAPPTHAVERGDELFGVKSIAVVDIDRAQNDRAVWADQISRRYRDQPLTCSS